MKVSQWEHYVLKNSLNLDFVYLKTFIKLNEATDRSLPGLG